MEFSLCITDDDGRKYEVITTSLESHEEQLRKTMRRIAKDKWDREQSQEKEDREQQNIDLEEAFARN